VEKDMSFGTEKVCISMKVSWLVLLAFCGLLKAQDAKFSGPPDANPPVSDGDLRIVRRAREILNSAAKWDRADNRVCPVSQRTYSLYCALEKATEEVSKHFEHRGAVMQEARFAIDDDLAKGNHYDHRLKDYNNDPKTTFADVRKFFNLLEERIKERLAAQGLHY
jgi:hypothetical protein